MIGFLRKSTSSTELEYVQNSLFMLFCCDFTRKLPVVILILLTPRWEQAEFLEKNVVDSKDCRTGFYPWTFKPQFYATLYTCLPTLLLTDFLLQI